ncbi:hypothetical protein Btru_069049 [Bulinus truncatus]|nr:hypothetical protein Btru_069049 [Bulinus truncatus]
MAEGPTPAKKLKTEHSSLPECPYGVNCYRKNPKHFEEFFHSKAQKILRVSPSDEKSESTNVSSKQIPVPDSSLPLCKYGTSCYRKNLLHFAEYSHPISGPTKDTNSSDTDVISSDDDQMTEIERKELIKKAIEEKLRLEQELENTKKIVAEKDKELNQLQKQCYFLSVKQWFADVGWRTEALTKDTTTYFSLYPERAYKEGSASQIHFRLAESQFYRLLTGDVSASIHVLKVDYVVSPKVVKRFRQCQENLKKTRGESFSYPILGFHGTDQKNIKPICENGFKAPGDRGFHHKTDSGWYGAGVYFSEFTKYSMNYISGCSQLMLCQILPGKGAHQMRLNTGSKKANRLQYPSTAVLKIEQFVDKRFSDPEVNKTMEYTANQI